MLKLEKVVLAKNQLDQIVTPSTSAWFEFYKINSDDNIESKTNSQFYKEDFIGIRFLAESNKLTYAPFREYQYTKQ